MPHFVYLVRCSDGSLYTGYCVDPVGRTTEHSAGAGAKYTRSRRPVVLVYTEELPTRSAALRREVEIKRWPKARKETLVKTQL